MWLLLLAAIHFIFTKKRKIDYKLLILYISFMAMAGPFGEIVVGTFYESIAGFPLWQYQILPTHNAYTSLYAPVIWGIAGAFLYYSSEILKVWTTKPKVQKASLIMFETILFEATLNLSFLALSGSLIFYYTPGDLWHITSLQTLPFYFLLGFGVMSSIKRMREHRRFYSALCLSLMFVVVYLTS
jgi:hypothetical protein